MSSNIPPLSLSPDDTGVRFMVGRHRSIMAERLGVEKGEFPQGLDNQKRLMKLLKAENPKRYNNMFDIVVRGIDPETVVGKADTIIKQVMPDDIVEDIVNKAGIEIDLRVSHKQEELYNVINENVSNALEHVNKILVSEFEKSNALIKEEVKKVKIVKHVYEVKNSVETKEIKGPVPECFQTVLDLAQARCNILLVGPAGCGKTHLSRLVAEALKLDYAGQSCSAGMSESAFSGWLLPIGLNGQFKYVSSEFVRMYENGGIFLFDEIDAADSNTLLFLNQALANGEFFLPQRFEKPHVQRHKDFVAIAAANTFGNGATAMYSGRNLLDGATMDRFRMGIVPMDYDPKVEEELIDPEILAWGRSLRDLIERRNLRKIMSTRVLIDATKMFKLGWSKHKIHHAYISDWSKDDRSIINHITASIPTPHVISRDDQIQKIPNEVPFPN